MRGTEYPRHYARTPVLLFSCQKDLRGTEYPRLYAALLFSCSPVKRTCAARSACATTHVPLFLSFL